MAGIYVAGVSIEIDAKRLGELADGLTGLGESADRAAAELRRLAAGFHEMERMAAELDRVSRLAALAPQECQCPNCVARRAASDPANKHGLN